MEIQRKHILYVLIIILIVILAVYMVNYFNIGNDGSNIKLVGATVQIDEVEAGDGIEYNYGVTGNFKNLPNNLDGFELYTYYYNQDGKIAYTDNYGFLSHEGYGYISGMGLDYLIDLDHVDVVIYNPDGDIVFNQTIPYDMSTFNGNTANVNDTVNDTNISNDSSSDNSY